MEVENEEYKGPYPIRAKLLKIQAELKAPKGQTNSFGGYKYRSCEDILEAVKPLLKANNCVLVIEDEVIQIGERYYIKATATLKDVDGSTDISNTAYAREEETKRGMDGSQLTGTASSYARKYALNGLFCIDDTKDADTDEHAKQTGEEKPITPAQIKTLKKIAAEQGKEIDEAVIKNWTAKQASDFISKNGGAK